MILAKLLSADVQTCSNFAWPVNEMWSLIQHVSFCIDTSDLLVAADKRRLQGPI